MPSFSTNYEELVSHIAFTHFGPNKATRTTTNRFYQEPIANAIDLYSSRGGGRLGLLGLFTPAAEYAAIPNTVPFVRPPYLGPEPVHLAGGGTGPVIAEINRQHKASTAEFNYIDGAEKYLKHQFLLACPD